jgi:hypothetical protein
MKLIAILILAVLGDTAMTQQIAMSDTYLRCVYLNKKCSDLPCNTKCQLDIVDAELLAKTNEVHLSTTLVFILYKMEPYQLGVS